MTFNLAAANWRLVAILLAAAALRFWIVSGESVGHELDIDLFIHWMREIHLRGIAAFYEFEPFCDYPPLMLLLFHAGGAIVTAVQVEGTDRAFEIGLKSLACGADLGIGLILYAEVSRLLDRAKGTLAAGAFLLNPVSVYHSAFWGQVDAIYTLLLLVGLVCIRRGRWGASGAAASLALAAKFQSAALLPLFALEAWRLQRWRGLLRMFLGAAAAAILVALPFQVTGTLHEVIDRAYIGVVGQYPELSKNAYNIWYLIENPARPDTSPPDALIRVAAGDHDIVELGDHWILQWNLRRLSLAGFALAVALALALYLRRPGDLARYATAGVLALGFFLFPTEMHERYAFPAIVFLLPWAVASARNERIYWALTVTLLLNLSAVLPPEALAKQIAAVNLALWAILVLNLDRSSERSAASEAQRPLPGVFPQPFLRWTRQATAAGLVAAILVISSLAVVAWTHRPHMPASRTQPGTRWLSETTPEAVRQEWKSLQNDRAVSGGPLRIGDRLYLRGLGTHAPALLTYAVPPGAHTFATEVGVDHGAGGSGSATVRFDLDGESVRTVSIRGDEPRPIPVDISLEGAKSLTIDVDPTDDGTRFDHVTLGLARFLLDD